MIQVTSKGEQSHKRMRPDSLQLHPITSDNVHKLKSLNSVIFPVSYTPDFYKKVTKSGNMARIAVENGVAVGAVCARVEIDKQNNGSQFAYVMTLGCLAPWRRKGIGTMLLEHIIYSCIGNPDICEIVLHVSISNQEAIKFYNRFGFEIVTEVKFYYKRVVPPHAYLLKRVLRPAASPSVNFISPSVVPEQIAACAEGEVATPQSVAHTHKEHTHRPSVSTRIKPAAIRYVSHSGGQMRRKVQCNNNNTSVYKLTATATSKTRSGTNPYTPVCGNLELSRSAKDPHPALIAKRSSMSDSDSAIFAPSYSPIGDEEVHAGVNHNPASVRYEGEVQCYADIVREKDVQGRTCRPSCTAGLPGLQTLNRPNETITPCGSTVEFPKIATSYIDLVADATTPDDTPLILASGTNKGE